MYKLNIQILDKSLEQYYSNHGPVYYDDAGIDLYIPIRVIIPAKAIGFKINLDINCELIDPKTGKKTKMLVEEERAKYYEFPFTFGCNVQWSPCDDVGEYYRQ